MTHCPSQDWNRCSDAQGGETTQLEDSILDLLEEAGIETEINDRICALVLEGEKRKFEREIGITKVGKSPKMTSEVELLRSENEKLKRDVASIRDECSNLLNCHIETPNLAKDALRRMRAFVNKTIENSILYTCRECEYYLHDPSESRIPFCRLLKTDTSAGGYCEKFERST